jgi:hypothetical protein
LNCGKIGAYLAGHRHARSDIEDVNPAVGYGNPTYSFFSREYAR